ncbi:MAG TPA: PIN domain nuclease [Phytomonospora sp.]
MALAEYLVDKSVWARLSKPAVREAFTPHANRGLLATCAMVEMELLFSARNPRDRDRIRQQLRAFEWLPCPDEIWERATQVQGELVNSGAHRSVKIPDLLIAAIAERHSVAVLHYDQDFDRISKVTGQDVRWIVPAGTAD